MLKAKRLKSMFVLYSACAVMATGFTSQAASERPEVTTITETKKEDANTHTAVQTISQNIVASAQEMTDASQQVIAENIAKKEEEERIAREKAEQAAREQAEREAREAYVRANQELMASIIYCEAGNQPYEGQVAVGCHYEPCQKWKLSGFDRSCYLSVRTVRSGGNRMVEQSQKFKRVFADSSAGGCGCAERIKPNRKLSLF